MSELYIKRQALRKDIRRADIDQYIRTQRQKLVSILPLQLQPLTNQELDQIYNQLEDANYSTDSLLSFIKVISERSTDSLGKPLLYVRLKRILNYIEDREQAKLAKDMVKKICQRVAVQGINQPNFFQKIFREFLQLIGIHSFELQSIWPHIGLIRNMVFFNSSFQWFLDYVRSYPIDIIDIIQQILQTFLNFTILFDQQQKIGLKTSNHLSIVDSIHKIMDNYTLDDKDLRFAALTLANIIKMYPIDEGLHIVRIEQVLPEFINYIDPRGKEQLHLQTPAISSIFELIGLSFAGTQILSSRIISKNRNLLEIICSLLPINSPFKKVKIPRPVQWTHHNISLIIGVLFVLCNITSFESSHAQIISSGALGLVIELSAYPSSRVQEQIGILLWNMLCFGRQQIVELLCDNDILYALSNILKAEHSSEALKYSIKSLSKVIQTASTLPANSNHWHFTLTRIKNILINSNTYSVLEHLCISHNTQIAEKATYCLQTLN